jgi:hypothetical protein
MWENGHESRTADSLWDPWLVCHAGDRALIPYGVLVYGMIKTLIWDKKD